MFLPGIAASPNMKAATASEPMQPPTKSALPVGHMIVLALKRVRMVTRDLLANL